MTLETSVILFHGPSARDGALDAAKASGRLLKPPIGDEGLKVDEAREVVRILTTRYIGERGVLVVGPLDKVPGKVSDVLLKVVEEVDKDDPLPFLWANELADVSPTIRSRCVIKWCPGKYAFTEDLLNISSSLCVAFVDKDIPDVVNILRTNKSDVEDLIKALSFDVLDQIKKGKPEYLSLWEAIRTEALYGDKATHLGLLSSILKAMQ